MLNTDYQKYIHLSRYSRWMEDKGRRETWEETVDRYITFFQKHLTEKYNYMLSEEDMERIRSSMLNIRALGSMRALMTAGPALERDHVAGYNCAYLAVDHVRAFSETLYILMCGTGVGFSVERQYVSKLPTLPEEFHDTDTTIVVADSKLGWAKALKELLAMLYSGHVPKWDTSKVRKAGERLKTFGGRASGPEPLIDLFHFAVDLFKRAAGRKLSSIECHDLMCKIADIVVVGGVRRSALISLSNLSDERMRKAKSGQWWELDPQRALANNSVAYTEKPDIGTFMREWLSLYDSKSGERGIFSRYSAQNTIRSANLFRQSLMDSTGIETVLRNAEQEFGCNPCSEINLLSNEFCNLSEVVARAGDTVEDLLDKVEVAAILGTLQSTLTEFKFINSSWKKNCEEERLLGVSITGIMDCELLNGTRPKEQTAEVLETLKSRAIQVNAEWAKRLGISPAAAITCVKPSGTVSQLVDSASGMHDRHSEFYIRTVRNDKKDPLSDFLIAQGFPHEEDVMKPDSTWVFSFPIKSPEGAITRNDRTAIEQLEHWLLFQRHWCEHKPSVTVSVKESEWMEVGAWVYANFDEVSGVSFLPFSEHSYRQAPYQDCSESEYEELLSKMPENVMWSALSNFELQDATTGTQELACVAGGCEL